MRTTTWLLVFMPQLVGAVLLTAHVPAQITRPLPAIHADEPSAAPSSRAAAAPPPPAMAAAAATPARPRLQPRPPVTLPQTRTWTLEHGEAVPDGHPNTWAYVPSTFDRDGQLHLVFVFHGFKNCIQSYTGRGAACVEGGPVRPGYDIAAQIERAGARAIVVVPETSFDAETAEAPALSSRGRFRAYVREVLDALEDVTGPRRIVEVERLALVASSGGYQALEPILDGNMGLVTDVLLLDAGYMYPNSTVGRFMAASARELGEGAPIHRVGLLFTPGGGAETTSFGLLYYAEERLHASRALGRARLGHARGDPSLADLGAPFYVLRVREDHDVVVRRNLGRVIAAAGL